MKRVWLGLLLACAFSSLASAGISLVMQGAPTFNGTDYTWTYDAFLNTGEGIGYAGTQSYFTIYDIAGLDGVGTLAPGWTYTEQLTGVTPATQLLTDSPTLQNLTFNYNGATENGQAPAVVVVQIFSSISNPNSKGVFSYQTNGEDVSGGYSKVDQGQGQTAVPSAAVPEPATMGMLGVGLIGLATLRRKRTR